MKNKNKKYLFTGLVFTGVAVLAAKFVKYAKDIYDEVREEEKTDEVFDEKKEENNQEMTKVCKE